MSEHDEQASDLSIYWPDIAALQPLTVVPSRGLRTEPERERTDTGHVVGMSENNTSPNRRLLTQKELAEYLQVPVRTIEDWRTREYGPKFLRVGRRVRYRESDVDAWLDAQEAA